MKPKMTTINLPQIPQFEYMPKAKKLDNTVQIEFVEGIPIFRATVNIQQRIESLLAKQKEAPLTTEENEELDLYEEVDDYLSYVNRVVRNLTITSNRVQ